MIINTKTFSSVILILSALIPGCDCTKNLGFDCAQVKYGFELPVKVNNARDTIGIGDTVWLEIKTNTSFIDRQTNQVIDYSGAENLGSAIAFQEIVGQIPEINDAVQYFNFHLMKGKFINKTSLAVQYVFLEESYRYVFLLGITPKKQGTYRFVLSNSNNTYRKSDKCTKANFSMEFKETNQHPYMFPGGANTPPGGSTYYFHVK